MRRIWAGLLALGCASESAAMVGPEPVAEASTSPGQSEGGNGATESTGRVVGGSATVACDGQLAVLAVDGLTLDNYVSASAQPLPEPENVSEVYSRLSAVGVTADGRISYFCNPGDESAVIRYNYRAD